MTHTTLGCPRWWITAASLASANPPRLPTSHTVNFLPTMKNLIMPCHAPVRRHSWTVSLVSAVVALEG
ncbi:MAG: hypothetical protein ACKOEM_18465, partial [Planctomycetia bacterium]